MGSSERDVLHRGDARLESKPAIESPAVETAIEGGQVTMPSGRAMPAPPEIRLRPPTSWLHRRR